MWTFRIAVLVWVIVFYAAVIGPIHGVSIIPNAYRGPIKVNFQGRGFYRHLCVGGGGLGVRVAAMGSLPRPSLEGASGRIGKALMGWPWTKIAVRDIQEFRTSDATCTDTGYSKTASAHLPLQGWRMPSYGLCNA